MTRPEPEPEPAGRRVDPVKVALLLVAGYLLVARWRAVHPPASWPRMTGPALDLAWPLHLSGGVGPRLH